ncbi:MAG: T9SS type A sorting domain-containing protein, partial [Bacteroidales bacterium]|nr:T9SS type A sorting domain-containing protein [Bacteroidales bacterium]
VHPVSTTPIDASICQGGSYDFHGEILTSAGTYSKLLQSVSGCDSTVVLTLTVHPVSTTPIDASICQGGSYDFHGEILTSAGTYSKLLQSVSGCDSTVVLTLTVHPVSTTPINASICQGGSYDFHGEILTSAGTYSKLLQSVSGCDSTVVLTLTVHSLPVPSIIGETNVATASIKTYSTEAGMTDYSWTVSGGTITTGNYTNSINVTWGTGGTGQLSVNYINTYGCSAATPTIKTIYISDTDIDVLELLVNGISVDLFSMQIAMICEVVSVYIEVITTHSNAYITVNSQSYNGAMLPLTSPVTEFRIRISSENGASHKDLLLIVTKAFPVNDIFVLRFDNSVLSVINNPTNNGGYTFERYKWYQSGIEMPGENRGYINIDKPLGTIYTYRAELETTEGLIFNTCDFTRSTITSMKVYPNPVKNNTSLIIEVDWEKTWIIMYNLTGNVVKGPMQIKGPKDEISISGLPTGLYWLKATNALNTKEEAIKQILVE